MKRLLLSVLLLTTCLSGYGQKKAFKIIAYVTSSDKLPVDSIRYHLLSHINYSFLIPTSTGELEPLRNPDRLQQIVEKAHNNKVKVFISIGGWNLGDGGGNDTRFELLAADPLSREKFIANVLNFVESYQLDGVDMDWEYPDAHINSGQAKPSSENFYQLMLHLAAGLQENEKRLSMAVVAKGDKIGSGVPTKVFDVVDWVNIMAYDIPGKHHSSLELAKQCLDYWIIQRSLPKQKAVLGLPFYGKYPATPYQEIVEMNPEAPQKNEVNGIFYNGLTVMRQKTQLAQQKASGVMFWELSLDVRKPKNSLLQAIHDEANKETLGQ